MGIIQGLYTLPNNLLMSEWSVHLLKIKSPLDKCATISSVLRIRSRCEIIAKSYLYTIDKNICTYDGATSVFSCSLNSEKMTLAWKTSTFSAYF